MYLYFFIFLYLLYFLSTYYLIVTYDLKFKHINESFYDDCLFLDL
jgi:hypothetical protein